jgi:hypothetical protein
MGLEFNNNLETFEQLNDTTESLENIGSLTAMEIPQTSVETVAIPETSEGTHLSTESFDRLESFVGFEPFECLNDAVVTEQIAEYLSGLESLKYENWKNLTLEQRCDLLNTIEYRIAKIEHRPPVPIKVEKMAPQTFGYQDSYNKIIALNSKYVMSDSKESYKDVIDTIIHEGRHAYQHYNVDKKCIHDSLSVVNTWRENFYDPKYKYYSGSSVVVIGPNQIGDVGYRLYYYQPVEIDARNFASDVMLKLKQKGFLA